MVTAGYGTFADGGALGDNDYLTAARTPDGALVMAYMPTRAHHHRRHVAARRAARTRRGTTRANGTFTAIAGLAAREHRHAHLHAAGQQRRRRRRLGAGAGSHGGAAGHAGAVGADGTRPRPTSRRSQITVSWTASTDNVGGRRLPRLPRRRARSGRRPRRRTPTPASPPLTSYSYTVAAFDYANNVSAPSAPLVVSTTAAPGPTFVQQGYATPQSPQSMVAATYADAQTAGDTNIVAIGWNDTSVERSPR